MEKAGTLERVHYIYIYVYINVYLLDMGCIGDDEA